MQEFLLIALSFLLVVILLKSNKTKFAKPLLTLYLNLILISFIVFFSYEFIYKDYFLKPSKEIIEYFITKLNKNSNIKNIQILKVEKLKSYNFNVIVAYQLKETFCTSEIKIIYEDSSWIAKKEKIEKCNRIYKI